MASFPPTPSSTVPAAPVPTIGTAPTAVLAPPPVPASSAPGIVIPSSAPVPAAPGAPAGPPPGAPPGAPPGMPPGAAGGHGAPGGAPGGMPEGPPGAHGPIDLKKINPYIYAPSFSMAVFGSAMFTISLVISTFQIFKYKCWYFNIMPQAILLDVIAMVARTHSIIYLKETGATGPYIIGQTVIGIAPTLVAIGTIFTMTRLVWWVTPNERRNLQTLMAPPKMISFMWAGFVSICDISKAVGQMGFPHGHPTGTKIMQIATVVQFFVYAGYAVWALRFMMISRRWVIHHDAEAKNWRSLGWSVVLASVMLAARHVFTIIASDAQGDRAAFYSLHEWVFWMTQMFPLFAVYTIFNIFHPGQFLPRDYTRFRLKLKEIEKMKNDNPWPTTISAPIYRPENDKGMEITLTELENGAQHRR